MARSVLSTGLQAKIDRLSGLSTRKQAGLAQQTADDFGYRASLPGSAPASRIEAEKAHHFRLFARLGDGGRPPARPLSPALPRSDFRSSNRRSRLDTSNSEERHHHFWDFRSERIPYQRYLLHELAADVNCGHNVRSTVFIEARSMYRPDGPVELRPVGEVEFVQGLAAAAATGLYGPCRAASAIVGHADLKLGDRVEPVLQALQAASPNRFRGIRHTVTWDPHPEIENREKEGVLATADYRAGARVLARMGLSLDVGVCFPQLPELADFAKAVPDLTIILNHLGGLTRVGPYANKDNEVLPAWQQGLAAVADCPNVHLKLGGIGMPRLGFDWHTRARPIGSEELATSIAPIMSYCIDQFGATRCMFESNFPVDKVSFSHHVLFSAFKRFSNSYLASERAALFHDTAARAYRISDG
jgi:L-fuconolactonase